mmetsp:Transcript_5257/g.7362  ORF Transcript_5257/g.7362 Transcript_5257/m.7362 type:complete len:80 (+) Transcript_5257:165-404(+)
MELAITPEDPQIVPVDRALFMPLVAGIPGGMASPRTFHLIPEDTILLGVPVPNAGCDVEAAPPGVLSKFGAETLARLLL